MSASTTTISDLKTSFYKGNLPNCLNLLQKLADDGDALAADIYGDLLMEGVWDTRKMEIDLVQGRLQTEHTAYLVLPRDPLKAIHYYQQASTSSFPNTPATTAVINRATAKIEYCQSKSLAGYQASHSISPKLDSSLARFLDINAKNQNDWGSNDFVARPDTPPLVLNPLNKVFTRMGLSFRNRCLLQLFFSLLLALLSFSYSSPSNALLFSFSISLCISAPLAIFAGIAHFQGYKNGLPLCSCAKISNAFDLSVKTLPPECKPAKSPFETTEAYVRYTLTVKSVYFWIFVLGSVVPVLKILINFKDNLFWLNSLPACDPKGVIFITLPLNLFLISLFILFTDKSFQSLFAYHEENGSALFYIPISLFLSVLAHDKDCERESERVKEKSKLELLIETL